MAVETTKQNENGIFLKTSIGGGGVETIPLQMWTTDGKEVSVDQWTGLSYSVRLGYDFNNKFGGEVFIRNIKTEMGEKVSNGSGDFQASSIGANILYHFYNWKFGDVYAGVGGAMYSGAELHRKGPGLTDTVKYDSTFGGQGLLGATFKHDKWALFLELGQPFVTFKSKEIIENGQKFNTSYLVPQFKEVKGSTFFDIGITYYF